MLINEIFKSIQGESSYIGMPCTFIRTAMCNLACSYCDTMYARQKGEEISIPSIILKVKEFNIPLVEITGGEPLLQKDIPLLIENLLERDFKVLVETNGSIDIGLIPTRAVRIMDLKCPGSGMSNKMLWGNIDKLIPSDEVKFVIRDRRDYLWSVEKIKEYSLIEKVQVLFSCVYGMLEAKTLIEWILKDNLNVRFQLQLHKYIWPHDMRGV
ncbi:MAG TPA: radical SAM protein [Candidatus Eremiobacteraeota bacterium]|nr:MAG: 7-carboxy-7-deazaguanine synthase [bacterium ADurb.Bin363]HPZ08982.1 radical SAM protein [Candidatus Eremiobacteraeota bacterium]